MFGILGLAGFSWGCSTRSRPITSLRSQASLRGGAMSLTSWGIGHTVTLFAFTGAALALGEAISDTLARPIELAVGIMLVGLGSHVLWRLWRDRVHFHKHSRSDGTVHIHAHSHVGEAIAHINAAHAHPHGFRWRTLLAGLMHGMAGSAALLVLAASQA